MVTPLHREPCHPALTVQYWWPAITNQKVGQSDLVHSVYRSSYLYSCSANRASLPWGVRVAEWLSHLIVGQEVPGSNPGAAKSEVNLAPCRTVSLWVQIYSFAFNSMAPVASCGLLASFHLMSFAITYCPFTSVRPPTGSWGVICSGCATG